MIPAPSDLAGQREGRDVAVTETAVGSTVPNTAFHWKLAVTDDFENTVVGTHQHDVRLPRMEQTSGSLALFSENCPRPCSRGTH